MFPAFNREVVSSNLTGPTERVNSSTVELRLVKQMVESSNLSSSANCLLMSEFDDEEIVINQYSSQTNGALAEWIYAPE